ncbi:FtsX-like permease family protein [Clostridium oceanicum]|uniref:ABC transporter permease n=1 Tax=Clostridium oceanicum TaxID=1543 RepID=A0ABP3UJJ9_9CLOT
MTFEKIILNNILRNLRIYIGYLLSSIFSVAIFFILTTIYYHPLAKEIYLNESLLFVKEVIYIITIFFIIYFLKLFIKSKKNDFGILIILGIDKKQLRKILFLENMVIGVLSIIIGIIFGIVFLKFFLVVISSIFEIKELNFYLSIKVMFITIIRYLVLFLVIPIVMRRIINIRNVIDLINYKKKETTKIKPSLVKSIIAIIIIVIGCFLVISSNINNILSKRLLIILSFFVLGNYLFFKYILNYVIYLISKNKKIYINKKNFLFISNLKYTLYNNISMLFIVTILLAVSFTSIGAAYIQKSILRKDAFKNVPFSLNYIIKDYSKYNNDEVFIDNMLKSNNIRYRKVKLYIIEISKNGKENNYFNLIKESEYNKIANIIKRKTVALKEKETILVPNYENILPFEKESVGKTIKLYENKNFVIKDNLKGCIASKGLLLNTFIISDKQFNSIYYKYKKKLFVGYEFEKWDKMKKITKEIQYKSNQLNKSRNTENYFISRMYMYNMDKQTSNMFLYFLFLIGSIIYIAAISFMNYKFYMELKREKNKYANMITLGLTFKELKLIISKEMIVIFFVPYILATIDAIFAYRILYLIYEIPILESVLQIVCIFLFINLIYFFIWRFKNISFLDD